METRLLLILTSDIEEKKLKREAFFRGHPFQAFHADSFREACDEIETLSLFHKPKFIAISDIDKLSESQSNHLAQLVAHLPDSLSLYLDASSLKGNLLKAMTKHGKVEKIAAEKPWAKKERLAKQVSEWAAHEGIVMPLAVAKQLVEVIGLNLEQLRSELDKLICYVGKKEEITLQDISALATFVPQETIWQLSDLICEKNGKGALKTLWGILQEGIAPLAVVSALRTQTQNHLQMLQLESGGPTAVAKAFPYLKGGLYEKKMRLLKRYGHAKFTHLLTQLYQTECALKQSPLNPQTTLECLIVKAT